MEARDIESKIKNNGLENQVTAIVDKVKALDITSQESYTVVAEARKEINRRIKFVTDFFKPIKQDIDKAKKSVLDREKELSIPLKEAREYADSIMVKWDNEQERIRQEQQRKLQEEAQLASAQMAEDEGDSETADAILEGNISIAPVIMPKVTPKVQGVSYRTTWKAEVYSIKDLARAVASGLAPESVLEPNMAKLNSLARASEKDFKLPGVRAVSSKTVASRG